MGEKKNSILYTGFMCGHKYKRFSPQAKIKESSGTDGKNILKSKNLDKKRFSILTFRKKICKFYFGKNKNSWQKLILV